ncbi:MAG: SpoIIE family protein phosphatase [Bacteroidota bacterium]
MLPSLLSFSNKKNSDHVAKSRIADSATQNYFSYLPGEEVLRNLFSEAYVINKPLDTVGGDGYWIYNNNHQVFLVAFDCMGHGRLASMMTRVYIDHLQEIICNDQQHDPAKILAEIHQRIQAQFENKDKLQIGIGADMAIIQYDQKQQSLKYSGAKMDLFKVDKLGKSTRIKACKRSLGTYFEYDRNYETTTVGFDNNDRFYLFSDGITDLFGGAKNKKIGLKGFVKMLEESSGNYLNPDTEKSIINEKLTRWSGNQTRMDDMLLISFKP